MYIDVSKFQGVIDWKKVAQNKEKVTGVILRSTTKDGGLDYQLINNYNGVLQNMSDVKELSVYKFSYAYNYADARIEAKRTLDSLASVGVHFDMFYLDLEKGDKAYTQKSADEVIHAYRDELFMRGQLGKFALYINYDYLKNVIHPSWRRERIWLARYNSFMGDVFGANVVLWQYTSTGKVNGISGNVDCSKEV